MVAALCRRDTQPGVSLSHVCSMFQNMLPMCLRKFSSEG